MTGKIFKHSFFLGVTVLVLCAVLFFGLQYAQIKEETYQALRQEAVYAANGVMLSGKEYLSTLENRSRITWIAADGSVIYDSEFGTSVSNQKEYTEVAEALESGEGRGIRDSVSGKEQIMYYAVRCEDGSVLRLSRTMTAVRGALLAVSPVLWVFVLVLLISGILAFRAAKQLTEPINKISLDEPDMSAIYPELAPLAERIQEQNLTIREQMDELARRQREFSALTDNMNEGFALTDRNGVVLSANVGAARIIGDCEEGTSLTECKEDVFSAAVTDALKGKRTDKVITNGDFSSQLIVNPVMSHDRITGAVVLIVDVTEREQREKLRREFSSNVSHELKTPLTSISGFAELMMQDMVTPDKVKEFSADIYRESRRLIALVNDIIKLSKLDEQEEAVSLEKSDIYSVAEDVVDSLRPAAEKAGVRITLSGGSAVAYGIPQYVDEIIYNLCDNAVKYNKKGGSVEINVSDETEYVKVAVSDTGIGIPYEYRERVFERFFRVNSVSAGTQSGTGLGLSIVKHAAQLCGARVTLESRPGEGTTVTVLFKKLI